MPSSLVQAAVQAPAQAPPPPPVGPVEPTPAPPGMESLVERLEQLKQLEHLEQLEQLEQLEHLRGIDVGVAQDLAGAGFQGPFIMPPHIPGELLGLVLGSLALIFLIVIGFPIARAMARRIDRQTASAAVPSREVVDRLERIEHAVETMAVEIERISEGQRFTTRLLSDQAGVGPGRS